MSAVLFEGRRLGGALWMAVHYIDGPHFLQSPRYTSQVRHMQYAACMRIFHGRVVAHRAVVDQVPQKLHLPWVGRRQFSATSPRHGSVQLRSQIWIPSGGITPAAGTEEDAHALLIRAGYLRQAHSGIFHLLPLGNRIQQKLEQLVDKHMTSIGSSKVALSSISSEALWQKSGRLTGHGSELFRFEDRKEGRFLLSPTHEEEITSMVAGNVKSYKNLPIRVYQISRKYRDEQRPRQGLLRGREFVMKDLYTFDLTEEEARLTYEEVRKAYSAFFDELKVPYLVAKADSGSMGGNLSHEYHFVSDKGEDNVISCDNCRQSINEELMIVPADSSTTSVEQVAGATRKTWTGISRDRKTLVEASFPRLHSPQHGAREVENEIHLFAVKAALPDIDLDTGHEHPRAAWNKDDPQSGHIRLHDPRLPSHDDNSTPSTAMTNATAAVFLTRTLPGDACPNCATGTVAIHRAIEIGHTFHLGTRYSAPLNAVVRDRHDREVQLQMGCHGIGVSRLMGAIAGIMRDAKGLNWPAVMAPFQVAVVGSASGAELAGETMDLARMLAAVGGGVDLDVLVDDRDVRAGWKLNEADLVGYPVIVIVGRGWRERRHVEVQCRRLGMKKEVAEGALTEEVVRILRQL